MNKQSEKKSVLRLPWFGIPKLLPYLRPYRVRLIVMVLFGLATSDLQIQVPLFQQYALNQIIANRDLSGFGAFLLAYVLVVAGVAIFNAVATYQTCYIEHGLSRDMKQVSFDHLQTLPMSYYNQNPVGYIHARVMSDTNRIGYWVAWGVMDGTWNLSFLVGTVIVMFRMNARLTMFVLMLAPLVLILSVWFQKRFVKISRTVREINSRISGKFSEGISGIETVKTLGLEERMEEKFSEETETMRKFSVRQTRMQSVFRAQILFLSTCALAFVLWQGGQITLQGVMQIGTLSVFMNYALNLIDPVQWIVQAISDLISVQVNIERFTGLKETGSEVADRPDVLEKYGDSFHPKRENWEVIQGDIEFRNVSFHYPGASEMVLEHFSLSIPAGKHVAIVGETGAGKSTLVNLLCRFFAPSDGAVFMDGKDVRDRSGLWLRSQIGYVNQEPHLFSGSIADNLRYAKPDAMLEEMQAAMRAVFAEDIPERLGNGYDSQVGENGSLLSAGERQLISFARAVMTNPRIFILDEATSSVDPVTEEKIQTAAERLMQGRTSVVIAHRLSTVQHMDEILFLDHGRIIERGTHEELMLRDGTYAQMVYRQMLE